MPDGIIALVCPGSTGEELGLAAGDAIVSVDGRELMDEVDYRIAVAGERAVLRVRKAGGATVEYEVEKDWDDTLGIVFESPVFDGVRVCNNRCVFCFVDQMPPDARHGTCIRDDDYRLSFLSANFVTLSNLDDRDLQRITAQRLSPLYVSVHSTDPEVRRRLFRSGNADRGLEAMYELLEAGIEIHAQIVIVPGYNDGPALQRTVADLAPLHPGLASVGIVPVGLTAHRAGLPPLQPVSPDLAADVVRSVARWQQGFLPRLRTRFCWAADELYLKAGIPLPRPDEYEDYPQQENGVGLCVPFLAELKSALRRATPGGRAQVLTGELVAPLLRLAFAEAGWSHAVEVTPIENTYLGRSVTVAGLVPGRGVEAAVQAPAFDVHVLPSVAVNDDGLFIDNYPVAELRPASGRLALAANAAELVEAISTGGAGP